MKNFLASVLTASGAICVAVLPANAVPPGAADSRLGSPVTSPSLVPIAATAINGLIQAESLQQKMLEDRKAADKAKAAVTELKFAPKAPVETVAIIADVATSEPIELPFLETLD